MMVLKSQEIFLDGKVDNLVQIRFVELVSAKVVFCGFWFSEGFCKIEVRHIIRGGAIMQDTELVVTATLCFASGGFHISTKNSYPGSAGTSVLVCGQSVT